LFATSVVNKVEYIEDLWLISNEMSWYDGCALMYIEVSKANAVVLH